MHQDYFHHQAYGDYPVVGVTWPQAEAFCNWRTKMKNDYLRGKKKSTQFQDLDYQQKQSGNMQLVEA